MYQNYNNFINELKSHQDIKYKDFTKKLTTTKYEIIGVRVPVLRRIAKEISKSNPKYFLEIVKDKYYEEVFIEGLVIASLKEEAIDYLDEFVLKIDNWAICDSFCNSLKFVKNDYKKYFEFFKNYVLSDKEFKVRVGLVVYLNFYVQKDYLKDIFDIIDKVSVDKYYVNMALAWLLAEMFIKYPNDTKEYLKRAKVNKFTFNKTISKICDSYRVSKVTKEKLKKLRR